MCIADIRQPDMPIVYANDAFCELTGYRPDEIVGRNCRFLQGPLTDPEDVDRFRAGLDLGRPFRVELVNYRKDGTPFRNQVFVSPMRAADGTVTRFLGMQVPLDTGGRTADIPRRDTPDRRIRHLLQTMTSLISLQMRRAASEETRRALRNVMGRFEAVAAGHVESLDGDPSRHDLGGYLAALVSRLRTIFDAAGDRPLDLSLEPVVVDEARRAAIGQVVAELLIEAWHRGETKDIAEPLILRLEETGDGRILIHVALGRFDEAGFSKTAVAEEQYDLDIVLNLVRGLDGAFERTRSNGFATRILIPGD